VRGVDHQDALTARADIISQRLRGEALLRRIHAVPRRERERWVDTLLGLPRAPTDEPLPRGGVPYLPAGIDEILDALRGVTMGSDDVFVDVGSGLGRVVLLAHLLTGVRAHGIEIQSRLVRAARDVATGLGLTSVSFSRADASDCALEGSVFFLYSPLTGEALRRLLFSLQELAQRQPIVVCTVGLELDHQPWLERRPRTSAAVSLYDAGHPGPAQRGSDAQAAQLHRNEK
jgi:hypothetical protein